jgi:hypothetical protein
MATESQRAMAASIGSLTRWAREPDRKAAMAPAKNGFDARFEREVDPNNELDPAERAIRAEKLKKAHMLRLALASAKARAAKQRPAA